MKALMKSHLIAVSLTIAILVSIIAVAVFYPKNQELPTDLPPEQFHWTGTVEVPTIELLDGQEDTPHIHSLVDQFPVECQDEYVYYRDDLIYSGRWYNWMTNGPGSFTLDTGVFDFPGAEAYITPILIRGEVEPHVIVLTDHPELRQAVIDGALFDKHWGIIIQLNLPEPDHGQLPLYTEVPAECWAGSYGGSQ